MLFKVKYLLFTVLFVNYSFSSDSDGSSVVVGSGRTVRYFLNFTPFDIRLGDDISGDYTKPGKTGKVESKNLQVKLFFMNKYIGSYEGDSKVKIPFAEHVLRHGVFLEVDHGARIFEAVRKGPLVIER